jgi:hypothetical protein
MATLWSIEALFVIPVGATCLLLLLSDIKRLQSLALSLCSIRITLGSVSLSLSSIFAISTSLIFLAQSYATLPSLGKAIVPSVAPTVDMADRLKMKEWRNDRNWWIALFACSVWLVVWRLQIWTRRYCIRSDLCSDSKQSEGTQEKPRLNKKKD